MQTTDLGSRYLKGLGRQLRSQPGREKTVEFGQSGQRPALYPWYRSSGRGAEHHDHSNIQRLPHSIHDHNRRRIGADCECRRTIRPRWNATFAGRGSACTESLWRAPDAPAPDLNTDDEISNTDVIG